MTLYISASIAELNLGASKSAGVFVINGEQEAPNLKFRIECDNPSVIIVPTSGELSDPPGAVPIPVSVSVRLIRLWWDGNPFSLTIHNNADTIVIPVTADQGLPHT